jgi:broad specificity phosphatase PhoE
MSISGDLRASDLAEVILTTEEQFKTLDSNKFVNVYLVRHHETPENKSKVWAGNRVNSHLTDEGAKQAREGAAELQRVGTIHAIYASESLRASESAQPLAEFSKLPCHPIANFHESDHGCLSGLTPEERKARMSQNRAYYDKRKEATRLEKFFVYPIAPDAELAFHAAKRVTEALTSLAKKHSGETVVVFGHGGPMQKLKYMHYIQQFERKAIPESGIPDDVENPKHGEAWHLKVSDRQIYILV